MRSGFSELMQKTQLNVGQLIRFRGLLTLTLFLILALLLQPALWFPELLATGSSLRTTDAALDLRPANTVSIAGEPAIATAPGWRQTRYALPRSADDRLIVISGLPDTARFFANGIMLQQQQTPDGRYQAVGLPHGYLNDGRNHFDIVAPRAGIRAPAFAVVSSVDAVRTLDLYFELYLNARWFAALLALMVSAGFAIRCAVTRRISNGIDGALVFLAGLVSVPGILLGAFEIHSDLPPLARASLAGSGLAVIAVHYAVNRKSGAAGALALASLFGLAAVTSLASAALDTLSPWLAIMDGLIIALSLSILLLLAGAAIFAGVTALVALIERVRRREAVIRDQKSLIDLQAQTLEAEIRKSAVLEERARFARDMHDGLGGSLLSLLVEVRAGDVSREKIEAALEANIDDMRLMIDSLDHADRSLASALSTFQTRIRPMFEASSIELSWTQPEMRGLPALPPDAVLNILRMLQEAASNIVRHSDATRAAFNLDIDREGERLTIEVCDDGSGQHQQTDGIDRPTSGLRTMASRIAALDGTFEAGHEAGTGWVIRASIPV